MRIMRLFALELGILFFVLGLFTLQAEPKVALVIGNGSYQYNNRLPNPVNDAADLSKVLSELGFTVTTLTDAGLASMSDAVYEFRNALLKDTATVGMFVFSGHGVQSGGANYLLAVDQDIRTDTELPRKAISAQEILDHMNEAKNAFNMVVLDACRNNPLSGSSRSAFRGLSPVTSAPSETLVVYSTGAGEVAEDGSGRNSPFAAALMKYIKQPGLDAEAMLRKVTSEVRDKTNNRQIPYKYSSMMKDYYFAGKTPLDARLGRVAVRDLPANLKVFLEGRELAAEEGGLFAAESASGERSLVFRSSWNPSAVPYSETVQVEESKTSMVKLPVGSAVFSGLPGDARFSLGTEDLTGQLSFIEGKNSWRTPFLPPGNYELTVSGPYYEETKLSFSIEKERESEVACGLRLMGDIKLSVTSGERAAVHVAALRFFDNTETCVAEIPGGGTGSLRLPEGRYQVRGYLAEDEAPGYSGEIEVVAKKAVDLSVVVPYSDQYISAKREKIGNQRSSLVQQKALADRRAKTHSGIVKASLIGSLATGGTSVAMYILGRSAMDSYRSAETSDEASSFRTKTETYSTLFWAGLSVTCALLGTSGVSWFTAPETGKMDLAIKQLDDQLAELRK